ncbi:hypothetical protein HJC23_003946 [Cyclotella cryptica]|uniref:HIT-type domain-containing protein n=1 Tax=Cyclotella cryptica TaxID=29204 RepID=A0ABD3PVK1_9STRA|eukprot:CCRYP_011492-RA/>CCRYP_011492-RA protein AED:0.21 eAED:0.15 QI:0/-1/0/1/-1/1/1/0/606
MSSRDDDYRPSPYSSILPQVRLSKPRPKLIQVLDLPPLPANSNGAPNNAVSNEISYRETEQDLPHAVHHVETVSTTSTGTQQENNQFIQVIGTKDSRTEQQFSSICSACTKHVARYKCPKCSAPYCSVQCYRIHDGTDVNPENSLHSGAKKLCTESFYKDRVLGEYHARGNDEDRAKLRGILNRMHQDINEGMEKAEWMEYSMSQLLKQSETTFVNDDVVSGLNEYDARISAAMTDGTNDQVSDEELAELASYILNLEDNFQEENEDDSMEHLQQLKGLLPPHLLRAFECALASAIASGTEIGQDCESNVNDDHELQRINASWKPWWRPGHEFAMNESDVLSGVPTLDERILTIPPLPTLISQTNNRNLAYNVLDVLFATSFAMRSLASPLNDIHASNDAADLLLSQSLVLSNNAIYENVYEALSSCAGHFVQMNKIIRVGDSAALSWDTVASDVALVSSNRRYVLRLLFEAVDLFEFATDGVRKHVKLLQKTSNADKQMIKQKKKELEETKRQYKLASKKIEYFQSWCSFMWSADLCRGVSKEVDAFVKHWKMPEQEDKEYHIESLIGNMLENKHSMGIKYGSAIGACESFRCTPIVDDSTSVNS